MSYSHGPVTGGVKSVKDDFRATFAANPLAEPEKSLRQKAESCLSEVQNKLGEDRQVTFTAGGSQVMDGNEVASGSLSISLIY